MTVGFDGPANLCTIEIKRDEDWSDTVTLQQLNADGSTSSLDFTLLTKLELYIRPVFDHATLIYKLSSLLAEGGQLLINPAVAGTLHILVARADAIANIPTGRWDHFLVATYASGSIEEFWRGPLLMHPGKI